LWVCASHPAFPAPSVFRGRPLQNPGTICAAGTRLCIRCLTSRSERTEVLPVRAHESEGAAALRRLIPLQEGARAIDGARLERRLFLPGEYRDLGIRTERGDID